MLFLHTSIHLKRVVSVVAGLSEHFEAPGYVAEVMVEPVGLALPFHQVVVDIL